MKDEEFDELYEKWKGMSDDDRLMYLSFIGMLIDHFKIGDIQDLFHVSTEQCYYDYDVFKEKLPLKWKEKFEEKNREKEYESLLESLKDKWENIIIRRIVERTFSEFNKSCLTPETKFTILKNIESEINRFKDDHTFINTEINKNILFLYIKDTDNWNDMVCTYVANYRIDFNYDALNIVKLKETIN